MVMVVIPVPAISAAVTCAVVMLDEEGVTDTVGVIWITAVPARSMVCVALGLAFRLLSVSVTEPSTVPLAGATGSNSTLMLQEAFAASAKLAMKSAGVPLPSTRAKLAETLKPR
jgi:hypothetical protein